MYLGTDLIERLRMEPITDRFEVGIRAIIAILWSKIGNLLLFYGRKLGMYFHFVVETND